MSEPLAKLCRACNKSIAYRRDDFLCDGCKEIKKNIERYQTKAAADKENCIICGNKGWRSLAHPKESNSKVTVPCPRCAPLPF